MSNISSYMEEDVLDHYLRGQASSAPASTFLAIFDDTATATELEAGTLTNEITGYTGDRPQVDGSLGAATQVGGKGTVTTTVDIDYADMPAVTTRWVAVMDAATAGNLLFYGQLTTDRTTSAGATLRFEAGEVTFDLD